MKDEEIQIRTEVENEALKQFYSNLSSGSYHSVFDAAKTLGERYVRLLTAYKILSNAFLQFNEIRDLENHILILSPKETKIIELPSDH